MTRKARDSAAIYREWLRRLPELTGQSHTAIAGEIGVAVSTLTRPIKPDDPGTSTPRQSTIDKVVERYGIDPPEFIVPSAGPRTMRGFAEDAQPYNAQGEDASGEAIRFMLRGRTNVSPWLIKSRALELAGYLPGDVALVDLSRMAAPGDIVCAQTNIDFKRGTAETVMRIYERAGASNILLSASTDPAFRLPLAVDDRVAIKGVVVGMVRPMTRAA